MFRSLTLPRFGPISLWSCLHNPFIVQQSQRERRHKGLMKGIAVIKFLILFSFNPPDAMVCRTDVSPLVQELFRVKLGPNFVVDVILTVSLKNKRFPYPWLSLGSVLIQVDEMDLTKTKLYRSPLSFYYLVRLHWSRSSKTKSLFVKVVTHVCHPQAKHKNIYVQTRGSSQPTGNSV